jgi:hypothetical protein
MCRKPVGEGAKRVTTPDADAMGILSIPVDFFVGQRCNMPPGQLVAGGQG